MALAILVTYLTLGARPTAAPPPTFSGTASTTSARTAPPSTTAGSQAPVEPTSAPPLPSATGTGPTDSPGTAGESPTPAVTSSVEPTPSQPSTAVSTPAAVGVIKLNDTSFAAPDGWALYGDELIETDRRLVRLNNTATNLRLQVVTLKSADADLAAACRALVASQAGQFTGVVEQPASPVGVDPATGTAATCGFRGVRASDGVANAVTFTLVRRAPDSHVLMLRSTVPDAVPADSAAPGQLAAMQCAASGTFGVALPLC